MAGRPWSASWEGVGVTAETSIDLMHQRLSRMNRAPRCGARSKRTGRPCRSPATAKGKCRMHGGAKGSGGPEGARNGRWVHGQRSGEMLVMRRLERQLLLMSLEPDGL